MQNAPIGLENDNWSWKPIFFFLKWPFYTGFTVCNFMGNSNCLIRVKQDAIVSEGEGCKTAVVRVKNGERLQELCGNFHDEQLSREAFISTGHFQYIRCVANIMVTSHIYVLLDFFLTVKAATLIFISGRGSAISSAKQGTSGSIDNLMNNFKKLLWPRKRASIS